MILPAAVRLLALKAMAHTTDGGTIAATPELEDAASAQCSLGLASGRNNAVIGTDMLLGKQT